MVVSVAVCDICRVARTHSRYWKLTKFHQASPPFLSFPYYRRSTSIKIQIQLSNYQIHQKLTQTPCKHLAHTCLFSTFHCYVLLSNASPLSYFPYSFPPPIPYCHVQSSWNLHHVEALISPNSTRGHSIWLPSTWPKSENSDFRFSPPSWIQSTGNLLHLKALLTLVNLT